MSGNFFAVDRHAWRRVSRLGMNAMATYLVLARGTGWDNATTAWSVHAVEKWTGISRARAREAHDALARAGLISPRADKPGAHITPAFALPNDESTLGPGELRVLNMIEAGEQIPVRIPAKWPVLRSPRDTAADLLKAGIVHALGNYRYERVEGETGEPDWLWLPNSLVTGVAREVPPVELVRQSSSATALRLMVEMYGAHMLRADGGIHWRALRERYERRQIGQHAQFIIYGFVRAAQEAWRTTAFVKPYLSGTLNEKGGDTGFEGFWSDLGLLRKLGLLEYVPHLIEADNDHAEILHPVCANGDEMENAVSTAAVHAAWSMLNDTGLTIAGEIVNVGGTVVLCPAHIKDVALVGIPRLRYKPKTRGTAAWQARANEYAALAAGFVAAAENSTGTRKHVA